MDVREFDFYLPADLIAQEPSAERAAARLLRLGRADGSLLHSTVRALPDLLRPGDLVVVNNTRVFPARLLGHRVPSGGAVECLLVRQLGTDEGRRRDGAGTERGRSGDGVGTEWGRRRDRDVPVPERWEALMHPGQKLHPGARVVFEGIHTIHGEVLEQKFYGRRVIRLWTDDGSPLDAAIDAIGHVPPPPYIKRADRAADRERYQTMFARVRGSVAAPTAGLHFTPELIECLESRGVQVAEITLHVGYGTFQPVRVERVEDHRLESESYHISEDAAQMLNRAFDEGRRVVAVGTTTT